MILVTLGIFWCSQLLTGVCRAAELQRELQEVRREIECNTTAQAGTPRTAAAAAARWPELAAAEARLGSALDKEVRRSARI